MCVCVCVFINLSCFIVLFRIFKIIFEWEEDKQEKDLDYNYIENYITTNIDITIHYTHFSLKIKIRQDVFLSEKIKNNNMYKI